MNKPKPMIEKSQTLPPPSPTGIIKILNSFTDLEIQQLKEILEHWNDSIGILIVDKK